MSADIKRLHDAAGHMRDHHGPDHERHEMWSAMADWLDDIALLLPPDPHAEDEDCLDCRRDRHALTVARAYLTSQEPGDDH